MLLRDDTCRECTEKRRSNRGIIVKKNRWRGGPLSTRINHPSKGHIMNAKSSVLVAFLAVAVALPGFAWAARNTTIKTEMKQGDPSAMMGKPIVDVTVDGLHMKVWLMTQAQHKEMRKGRMDTMIMQGNKMGTMGQMRKNDSSMGMGKAMMAGTHHMMLEATDTVSGKDIANASAEVVIVSPSKKSSSVELTPMMNHFGGALTLAEKGEYTFTLNVKSDGVTKTTRFEYEVK